MLPQNVKDAIAHGDFVTTSEGLLIPKLGAMVQGVVTYSKRGEPEELTHNLIVTEGLNYLLGAALRSTTPITSWHVAVFTGDVEPQASWTAANFSGNATEFTQYAGSTRVPWTGGTVAAGAVDSFAAKASFESSIDGATLRGAALISSSSKGGTAGVLIGATRFPSAKSLDTGEILDVGYGVRLVAA